jgi:hypothetical protein
MLKSKLHLYMLRPMEHAGAAFDKIVTGSLRRVRDGEGPVVAWPLVCGAAVAHRTRAVDFSEGTLHVQVPDAGWKTELKTLAAQYLAVINRYVRTPVKRIEFVVPPGQDAAKGSFCFTQEKR